MTQNVQAATANALARAVQAHARPRNNAEAQDPVPTPSPLPSAQKCTPSQLGKRPETLCKLFQSVLTPESADSLDCTQASTSFANLYTNTAAGKDSRRGEGCLLDTSLVQAFFRVILADNADLLSADAQATLQATKNSCERSEDERVFAAAALATMTGAPQQAAECKPWYELWWVWLIVALGVLLVALAVALGVSESRRHHAHSEAMAAEAGHVAARQTAARLLAGRN